MKSDICFPAHAPLIPLVSHDLFSSGEWEMVSSWELILNQSSNSPAVSSRIYPKNLSYLPIRIEVSFDPCGKAKALNKGEVVSTVCFTSNEEKEKILQSWIPREVDTKGGWITDHQKIKPTDRALTLCSSHSILFPLELQLSDCPCPEPWPFSWKRWHYYCTVWDNEDHKRLVHTRMGFCFG